MIPLPDIDGYPSIEIDGYRRLFRAGVPVRTLMNLAPIRKALGTVAPDGRFEEDPGGQTFLVFPEAEDAVYWQPQSGKLATWNGRAFALGEDAIYNAETYAFDCHLNIFPDPLEWLRDGCDGIVVLDWSRAFDTLRDCPRIAVQESVVFQYRKHMKPARLPKLFVIPQVVRDAA
jgi:hypothetical protein